MKNFHLLAGCRSRFAHANRRCSDHPSAALKREDVTNFTPSKHERNPEVVQWLERYLRTRVCSKWIKAWKQNKQQKWCSTGTKLNSLDYSDNSAFRYLEKRRDRTPKRSGSRATKRSLNLQQDDENCPIDMTSPNRKRLTSQQPSRTSVIVHTRTKDHDLSFEDHSEMGVRRLQSQTPVKSTPVVGARNLTPLQDVPLNLSSPNKLHVMQPFGPLPLPDISSKQITEENALHCTSSEEQHFPFHSLHAQIASLGQAPGKYAPEMPLPQPSHLAEFQPCFTTPPRRLVSARTPGDDTLLGALALVELSQSPQ